MTGNKINHYTLYLLLALSGAVIILINTWNYGIGLTNDSINYVYSGINLAALKGLFNYDGTVFITWPPLYSALISFISFSGINVYTAMLVFNVFLYSLTVYLLFVLSDILFSKFVIKILFTLALTLSYHLLFIYTKIWSETIFITLFILIIILVLKNNTSFKNGYVWSLLILLTLTRYIGVSVSIAWFIICIYYYTKPDPWKKTVTLKTFAILTLSLLPVIIWLIRNMYLTRNITHLKLNTFASFGGNFYHLLNSLSSMFFPESFLPIARISLFVLLLIIICFIQIKVSRANTNFKILGIFISAYIGFLFLSSGILSFEKISPRYILPVYFILMAFLFRFLDTLLSKPRNTIHRGLIITSLVLVCVFPVGKGLKHSYINCLNGIEGFHSKTWVESETIKYVNANLYNQNVYSNSASGIYANTGLVTKKFSDTTKYNPNESGVVQVIFNKNLPEIETVTDLAGTLSVKDSIIYFYDSYIIVRKN